MLPGACSTVAFLDGIWYADAGGALEGFLWKGWMVWYGMPVGNSLGFGGWDVC